MKTCTITAAIAVIVGISSAQAAKPSRRRTQTAHKSARVDESYDPYLGMGERRLEGDSEKSMPGGTATTLPAPIIEDPIFDGSMSMSMPVGTPPPGGTVPPPTPGSTPSPTASSASSVGTTVSVLAAAGAMMLL